MTPHQISVITSQTLPGDTRQAIIDLCSRAYEEDFAALFDTFTAEAHVLGYIDEVLVSHALWVTRWLQIDGGPLLRTAYVEAVATEQAHRGQGYASAIMRRVVAEIQAYDLGALSPFSVAYYERLGWELWRGPLYIRTATETIRTPRDGDVMIMRLPKTPKIDLYTSLSAEWREGELW
jgi:aminoglycoside 2'-N-acetyltransferase I